MQEQNGWASWMCHRVPPCGAMRVARCSHNSMCVTATSRACLIGIVVVAGSIYRGKMQVQHELQQNCVTVTDHGVLFRRL